MKTNALNRKAIAHLEIIGYKLQESVEKLCDAPYLFFTNDIVEPCFSAIQFHESTKKLITQENVLKLRPINEKTDIKKLSKRERDIYKLLNLLNNPTNSKIAGYDVSWTIQKCNWDDYQLELLPNSPYACGSISMKHLEIIIGFVKNHPWLSCSFGYTDWNDEKKIYGTSTPCVRLS